MKDVENSTTADSLKQLPLRSANEQVNKWLSHESKEPAIYENAKTRSSKSKSRSSSHSQFTERLSHQLQLIQSLMETNETDLLACELSNLNKIYTSFSDSYTTLKMIIKAPPHSSSFRIFETNFQKMNCYFFYEKQF